ncbi:MAG: cell division protein FtsA [Proteobacteria bacterium]|nr:cell division protein FtsA [Pseudomonadota bacterium]
MPKQRTNIVGILDIGSSKVVCFIAKVGGHGRLEVIGIGYNHSGGVRAGVITDIKALERAIVQAVEAAEKMAEESVQRVYVGVTPNTTISSMVMSSELLVSGHEISNKDEKKLLFQVLDKYADQGLEIIHSFAYEYMLDGHRGIGSPLGMYGNKLACEYHLVYAQSNTLINLTNCMARCQLDVDNYVLSAYASGLACLTQDEMDLGVTLIELGGGATSVSIFHRGQLIFSDGIPLGGTNITNDIARGLSTDYSTAERIKTLYGSVLLNSNDEHEKIEVPISEDAEEVNITSRAFLVEIVRARMEETLEILRTRLDSSPAARLGRGKVVITGGGAQLNGVRDLVGQVFSSTVRVGYPRIIAGLAESTRGPSFSTAAGMLIYAAEVQFTRQPDYSNKGSGTFSKVVEWFKEHFVA